LAGTIAVRFYALLRRRLRTPALEVEADALTVRELLLLAEKKAGQPFLDELLDAGTGLLEGTMILVNGENIRLKQKLETQVGAGADIRLGPSPRIAEAENIFKNIAEVRKNIFKTAEAPESRVA